VADNSPVVGFDPVVPGFVWHAGQGGYGIMMAPALAQAVASLCLEGSLPAGFMTSQISKDDLGPARLARGWPDNPLG
jgi:D-arginine dehydrogenase